MDLINNYSGKQKLFRKFPCDQHFKSEYGYIVAQIEIKLSKKTNRIQRTSKEYWKGTTSNKQYFNLIPILSGEKAEYVSHQYP